MVDHADEVEGEGGPGQAGEPGGERIAKALARAGVASRRDVERLIAEGRVRLNGRVLDSPAVRVGPADILMVDDAVVSEPEGTRLWRYHKPVGLITAHKDPGGRPTVFEHLPAGLPRVISVGRLDLNSEGLLLLTNDGALARALELPSTGWVRRYRARAHGRTDQGRLDRLMEGVVVDGVRYGPIEARLDKAKEGATGSNLWLTVSLTEGKNREVRKVLESLGLKVNRLIRLAYGPFQLGTLPSGAAEEVGPRVLKEQLSPLLPGLRTAEGTTTGVLAPASAGGVARRTPGTAGDATAGVAGARPSRKPPKAETAEKKVYKAGWAKAKVKPGPSRPTRKPRDVDAAPTSARVAPRRSDSPAGVKPGARPRPESGGAGGPRTGSKAGSRAGPKPGPKRPAGGPGRRR